jgi:hypothetical protein
VHQIAQQRIVSLFQRLPENTVRWHDGSLKRDEIWMNHHRGCCLRMIFSENRCALFRIMV